MEQPADTVIIGGGAAGLFCAIHASESGGSVVVLEKNDTCGKKLLLTGSGQCNLTADGDIREFFSRYGDHGKFLQPALLGFSNRDLIDFFESRGCPMTVDGDGRVFPASRKAADVLALLLGECEAQGVAIRCGEAVQGVGRTEGGFAVETAASRYTTTYLVVATGGASYPATGSTGDGYRLAAALGQPVTGIRPALTPVSVRDHPFSGLAGISFPDAAVSLVRDGKRIRQRRGDLLFTHRGLSGPVILDLSRYIAPDDVLEVSFLPDFDRSALDADLVGKAAAHGTRQVATVLTAYGLPERFAGELVRLADLPRDQTCAHLSKTARQALVGLVTACPFAVDSCIGFNEAMVTAGGITLDGVDPKTMESRIVPGLFFIGEVLDIDGDTGGYNLQAAFSTARAAAREIRDRGESPAHP